MLLAAGVAAAYAGGVIVSALALMPIDSRGQALALGATELVAKERGVPAVSDFIHAGTGAAACSELLLEPMWRAGCSDIWVRNTLSPKEVELVLDFLEHPCRYAHRTRQPIEKEFACANEKASRRTKLLVTIYQDNAPLPGGAEERFLQVE